MVSPCSIHMSPLWGFGYLVYAVFYKHAAPLGLNAAMHQNSRHGTHRRGEVSSPDGLGNPTPTGSTVPSVLFLCSAFFASLRPCVKLSFDSRGFADGLLFSLFAYHVSFPLKLRFPFLHERPPTFLIILAGETGIHKLFA